MTWDPEDLRREVLREFVDAARFRGAIEAAESAEDRQEELRRTQEQAAAKFREERDAGPPRRRRIVSQRAA